MNFNLLVKIPRLLRTNANIFHRRLVQAITWYSCQTFRRADCRYPSLNSQLIWRSTRWVVNALRIKRHLKVNASTKIKHHYMFHKFWNTFLSVHLHFWLDRRFWRKRLAIPSQNSIEMFFLHKRYERNTFSSHVIRIPSNSFSVRNFNMSDFSSKSSKNLRCFISEFALEEKSRSITPCDLPPAGFEHGFEVNWLLWGGIFLYPVA